MYLARLLPAFLAFFTTATYAQSTSDLAPLVTGAGVGYSASCVGGDEKYELWVELPNTLSRATLSYTHKKKKLLSIPLAVLEYTKEDVSKISSPDAPPESVAEGFHGFHIVISDKIAKESVIVVSSADGSAAFKLDPVIKWYCVYRP